jgi:chromate transport protein ChrA
MLPLKRYIPFIYWVGYYFIARYFLKSMKNKIILKNYHYWLISSYLSAFVLGIPFPFNYFALVLMFIVFMKVIKREIDSWTVEKTVGNTPPNKSMH